MSIKQSTQTHSKNHDIDGTLLPSGRLFTRNHYSLSNNLTFGVLAGHERSAADTVFFMQSFHLNSSPILLRYSLQALKSCSSSMCIPVHGEFLFCLVL